MGVSASAGLAARLGAGGSLTEQPGSGQSAFFSPPPFAWDSGKAGSTAAGPALGVRPVLASASYAAGSVKLGIPASARTSHAGAATRTTVAAKPAATGYGLDGQDPYATGCASNGALVVNSAPVSIPCGGSVGTAYLWYSNDCGTNWVSGTTSVSNPEPGRPAPIETDIYRQSPYLEEPYTWWGTYPAGAHSWSNMVYAPTSCAKGYVSLDVGFATASTWVYQHSCRF